MTANARHHFNQILRLDRQDHDMTCFGDFRVVGRNMDTVSFMELVQSRLQGVGSVNGLGGNDVLRDQAADHRFAHNAAADERNVGVGEHECLSVHFE